MRFARAAALVLALGLPPVTAAAQSVSQRPTNVRLTFHLIEADGEQREDPEIQAVTTELRKLFRFQGYRLVSKSILNATAWPHSNVQQKLTDDLGRAYNINASVESNGTDVRLGVSLSVAGEQLIDAAVNLQDGKTVVLGTTSGPLRGQSRSSALILAVTPTINP